MELCGSQQALHEECDIVEDTVMQDGCKLTRCIRCSLSTRIGMRTEFFENDRPMILGWIVTRVVRLRAVLVRVRFGSGTRLHFTTGETASYYTIEISGTRRPLPNTILSKFTA